MRRALLLAIASLASADTPEIRLPEASAARPPLEGTIAIGLSADGLVLVEQDGKTEAVSMENLALWLCARIETFEKKPKDSRKPAAAGESGTPTKMAVLLRADENAPWLHVQRVLEACREAGITRVAFGVKGARGEEGRLGPAEASRAWHEEGGAKLTVVIAVTKEETAVWGPAQTGIRTPAELTFRMGGIASTRIDAVRRYLRDAGQTAAEGGAVIKPLIEPDATVPWGTVASVLNEYHRAGLADARIKHVERPATDEERRAARLPYPSSSR